MFHCKCIQNRHNNTHWTTLSCNGRSCSTINYHSSAFNVHSGLSSVGKLDKVAHQALSWQSIYLPLPLFQSKQDFTQVCCWQCTPGHFKSSGDTFSLPEMARSDEQNVWVVFSLDSTELVIIMVSNTHFIKQVNYYYWLKAFFSPLQ